MSTEFQGSSGNLAGSVTFAQNGDGNLYITLKNTGGDVLVPAEIMTAFFFNIAGRPVLSTMGASAVVSGGSAVYKNGALFNGQTAGTNVGGEWAYQSGMMSGVPYGATQGLSSSGLGGLFDHPNLNGPNLDDPNALDGMQYGLLSENDNLGTDNGGVSGNPLIKSSVNFVLTGWTEFEGTDAGFRGLFSNMSFQYGTGDPITGGEPNVPVFIQEVPVPAGVILLGIGGAVIAAGSYRRNRRQVQLA